MNSEIRKKLRKRRYRDKDRYRGWDKDIDKNVVQVQGLGQ
jgi:hypothetical protein